MDAKIHAEHLQRGAIVYIRQSTTTQVRLNTESTRLQYALADKAREMRFAHVQVIDDDLGRSGSGTVERHGFNDLVGAVCAREVGAIFCIEDARLARNGREWHHLIELCALTDTLVIDPQGVFNPRVNADRLFLGFKGSMAEYELSVIRQRSLAAIRAKAERGELRFRLPVGLCWTHTNRIERDPSSRVCEAIDLVLAKFSELGSVYQALRWFRRRAVTVPVLPRDRQEVSWRLPDARAIHSIVTNPFYAGAYAFGRTESRTQLVGDRARKTSGHRKPMAGWTVLIRDHHEGYISWTDYVRNLQRLEQNSPMVNKGKTGRGGRSLLIGLLRCGRCGRSMSVEYKGATNNVPRYLCGSGSQQHGVDRCISFGGLRVDEAVAAELLRAIDAPAIDAAVALAETATEQGEQRRRVISLELEQARYEARLAERRYEAVDPDNRLVASGLESRWNAALHRVAEFEARLRDQENEMRAEESSVDRRALLALSDDLASVWNAPTADSRLKQRIARLLVREVVADVDNRAQEIVLVIHWAGGRHSELRVAKNKPGHTSHWTDPDAVKVIRRMAGDWCDRDIALTLNRLGLRSGTGLTWTEQRVYAIRHRMGLPAHDPSKGDATRVSLDEASRVLGVSTSVVRRLMRDGILPAIQVTAGAPWQIERAALDAPDVREAATDRRGRAAASRARTSGDTNPTIPGI